jgi:adenosylmethionine-8-amino-7-oxononanoate aminotransferase
VDQTPSPGGHQDVFFSRASLTVPLPLIVRSSGIRMWDEDGNEYIDASSGPVVSNIGHGNERVAEAMAAQARTMPYAFPLVARNRPAMAYAERLARLAGPGFERVSLVSGGSEAMENAIKFLRQYAVATGRAAKRRIITCLPCYHGATVATLGLNNDDGLATFLDGFAPRADKVPAPLDYRLPENHTAESHARACTAALEDKILELGAENVLAFVIEPVGGLSTGCLVPPAGYFRAIRDICTRHGVFLVFDEVLCGTGRTGKFLAAQHWPEALPDVVVLAKALGAGYSPLGAMLAPAAMVDELAGLGGFPFVHSYYANPVSCAAGLAVLDEYQRLDLMTRATEHGAILRAGLEALAARSPIIGDVRGLGMLMAVEMVADKETREQFPAEAAPTDGIRRHGLRNGLMLYARPSWGRRFGDWFIVAPPLIITEDECDELLRRIEVTVNDFAADLAARPLPVV